jgi:hypothetical protein
MRARYRSKIRCTAFRECPMMVAICCTAQPASERRVTAVPRRSWKIRLIPSSSRTADAFASNPLCNLSSSVGFQTRNRRLRFWVGDKKFDGPFSISELNEPTERVRRSVPKLSWGSSSRLTPAAIRPNERSESAFRAAANAVFAAAVTPGASPRAFRAAFSRSSASLSLRGLLSAMRSSVRSI